MKRNKYEYVLVIQGYYGAKKDGGYGWEDLCEYDKKDWKLARTDLKEYRYKEYRFSYRLIHRRNLILRGVLK